MDRDGVTVKQIQTTARKALYSKGLHVWEYESEKKAKVERVASLERLEAWKTQSSERKWVVHDWHYEDSSCGQNPGDEFCHLHPGV